jgi:predicted Zn-dependent protease with MMP-like domain
MTREEFESHVRAALDSLPPHLARALDNVAVVVEEEHPEDPDLFGLYHGVPLTERGSEAPLQPDTISIYRRPLVDDFGDVDELRDEIRVTVLHELGHYFGIDEDRLDELGYA